MAQSSNLEPPRLTHQETILDIPAMHALKRALSHGAEARRSLSQHGDHELASVRNVAVFPKKDALPGSEFTAAVLDRQRER